MLMTSFSYTLFPLTSVSHPLKNNLTSLFSSNNLSANPSKSKYMYFSHRHQLLFNMVPSLSLSSQPIDSFKYPRLLFTCNLSWSCHVSSITCWVEHLIGLIYRQFYHQSSPQTLLSLYLIIIHPILEYTSPKWDPSLALKRSLKS